MNERVKFWLGTPSLIVGVCLSLGTMLGWFGFRVATPEDTLQNHLVQEQSWRNNAEFEHENFRGDSEELHTDVHEQKQLMEALVIRSCLRDDYQELVLQRLLQTCTNLGITRVPNDSGVRQLINESDTIG